MSFIKAYLHFVWSTKKREPFLANKLIRQKLWFHIKQNSINKGIFVDCVNGYADHCHCLISLTCDQSIQNIAQLIKGESSYWINQQADFKAIFGSRKFQWQKEYYVISVSESALTAVRNYIFNQEEHHRTKTFNEEVELIWR